MSQLSVRALKKNFGTVEVLKGVSFAADAGDFICLLGPSGCGKSTLLRCIAGLEQVTAGAIDIGGRDMTGVPPAERNLAMVFQSYALYPHLSVRSNMAFGLKLQGMARAEIDRRVNAAAAMLRLDGLLARKPRQLSGGQRQRVAIGRAIVREPQVFLFDEPLSNLDAALRTEMRHELAKLHRELGRTMIFVTHDQVEAMTLANKVVVLNGGVVEQIGRPLDLYHYPANRFVARFIGSPQMNIFPASLLGAAPQKDAESIGIRPEDMRVTLRSADGIPATVRSVEQLGAETLILGETQSGGAFTARREGTLAVKPGTAVSLHLDAARLHSFDASGRRIGGPQPGEHSAFENQTLDQGGKRL